MIKQTFDQLSAMLAKLATDDGFRDRMQSDPVRALSALGIELDPAKVPAVRSLPSKQVSAADHATFESKEAGERTMVLFMLSGVSASRLAT
ncbi:UNVERIFIED_ORG: putative modified peptide [Zoogloea ramigera]|uniref:NHLP-related RiPP peptide n=1 Tax=Duganella zoogloeoides TaxID=75659 RepID=A0ABZ0XXP2_9BURK|nr:NHLP-related RiPP peptide [Duganella zoogloeoides]WQH04531.1 NHLP-related RiPP peptide [Duganella zoogloeoides]